MRERIYLNNDWKFSECFTDEMCLETYDAKDMADVRIPHTCKELPLHYFDESMYQMVSGYRKVFPAPEHWRGQKIVLTFEGVAHDSEVYLNGEKVAVHHCGYTAFSVDLSEKLCYGGENLLTVRVDSREDLNVPPFGFVIDYMTYGGIYRDVYLEIFDQKYLKDVFVKPQALPIALASEVTVAGLEEAARIRQLIRKKGEGAYVLLGEQQLEVSAKTEAEQTVRMLFSDMDALRNIELWDVDTPVLYEVKTQLLDKEVVLDERIVTTGFRRAEFLRDGFYLNGKKLRIRGLNRHQSYPYVGYAMPGSAQKTDAEILKNELGVNAVRTSHYPQPRTNWTIRVRQAVCGRAKRAICWRMCTPIMILCMMGSCRDVKRKQRSHQMTASLI